MSICRSCGRENARKALYCVNCNGALSAAISPLQASRRHLRDITCWLLGCGATFCLFIYVGIARGTLFQTTDGSMRWPHAGRNAPILALVIASGLATVFLVLELFRSWRSYRKELEKAKN